MMTIPSLLWCLFGVEGDRVKWKGIHVSIYVLTNEKECQLITGKSRRH